MTVVINARGTSIPFFSIGKNGITLYQGSIDPSLTYTVKDGDMWLNNSAKTINSWNSTSWTSTGTGPFKFPASDGANGQVLSTNSAGQLSFVNRVSTISIVPANGFTGSITNATSTPALTLATSVTGLIKGNGTSISAATQGTDYSLGTSALTTGILKSTTTSGTLSIAVAADFPILNQNTTGTSTNVSGIVAITNGGTGANNASSALTNLGGTATGVSVFTAASATLAATALGLGNVDNTSDVNKPVSTAQQAALDLKANLASPAFTGTVTGITATMVGLGNVTNTSDANKPVSTAQQTALNLKANLAGPTTFTGTITAPTPATADSSTLVATTAFVYAVTGNALAPYALIASPTFTGTPSAPTATAGTNTTQLATTQFVTTATSAITKASIGLSNVDNTSDANKPVSTAQQTALNLKLDVASPTVGAASSLTVASGTTTVPPIKYQSGVVTTTPVNHAKEWDGTDEWQTSSAGVRRQLAQFLSSSTLIPGLQYGQCKLSLSGVNLILNRLDGSYLFINGYFRQIPTAGITLAVTGASANFTYYIYASWSGSAIVLSFSTAVPVTDSTYGHRVKTGDATMTLVGMARTDATPAWVDNPGQRFVLSWFNQTPKSIIAFMTTNFTATSPSDYVSLAGQLLAEFLHWSNTDVRLNIGGAGNVSAGAFARIAFEFDFAGTPSDSATILQQAGTSAFWINFNIGYESQFLSEGYHGVSMVMFINPGTGTIAGTASAGTATGRTTIYGSILG